MKQVAIVGLGLATHDDAPFVDPEWECWGLPWDREYWVHYDQYFEMHPRSLLELPESKRETGYFDKLAEIDHAPIYMHQHWDDIPNSVAFPIEEMRSTVFANFPRKYWKQKPQVDWYNSSPGYMLAKAIHEEYDRIGLWGFDMESKRDYTYELPNLSFLIGLAIGRGIDVYLHEGDRPVTPLLEFTNEGIWLGELNPVYTERYGYLNGNDNYTR